MATPQQRPGFSRVDTDMASGIELQPASSKASGSKAPLSSGLEIPDPDSKTGATSGSIKEVPAYHDSDDYSLHEGVTDYVAGEHKIVETAEDIVNQVLSVEDDPTLNPWTFRMFFLGFGLSIFASVLQEIFYFKPQTIYVSSVFLCVIAYVLGEAMAKVLPSKGVIGSYLNPHPFNMKEHAAITLMASAAGQSALATEVLAAQELWYGGYPSKVLGVFITLSSQLIGYGIAGLLREVLVYPTRMLWPINLPVTTLLESLHKDKVVAKQKIKVFYILFIVVFVWEVFPEYLFPVLEGVSIFCLANQKNLVFTNLFGGASGNEGLGILSFCFDWQYIASLGSPLWLPPETLTNSFIGYVGCVILFMGLYYGNLWRAQDFPFLAQVLFTGESNGTNYVQYNQTLILNSKMEIDQTLLDTVGPPHLTATYIGYLITSNAAFTATFVHMLLWNYEEIKAGWAWAKPSNLRKLFMLKTYKFWQNQETPEVRLARKEADPSLDPHYKLMLRNLYPEWWWGAVVVIAWALGLGCLYGMDSTLPWWGFLMSTILTFICVLFFGAQMGITGFQFNIQPICQMLGGYMFKGRPLANMCYTYNALQMAEVLAKDLKLGQYMHLAPRTTFFVQMCGCILGALFNYIMMISIVENQGTILKSIAGSNIWSGQNVQQFNTLAIAWSMPAELFSIGGRYEWVTISYLIGFIVPVPFWLAYRYTKHPFFKYMNVSMILWYMGWLFVGINASIMVYFIIGFVSQWYVRRLYPELFVKYNYIVSAALDGGTQVLVFILTFAVFGGSGKARPFPTWAGNPDTDLHNLDYCMVNPATSG
ncbi:OPT superfamily oligopeptide transporter [Aureobasidium sp. EXF-3400]|nr:OPT superfamily oligopeptide transporter [Aureobasidium sp. EXF-12344]KAI4783336.1 OPT superfamily oligopeptide transporter [Aureobasidium sp. EXF-3400]